MQMTSSISSRPDRDWSVTGPGIPFVHVLGCQGFFFFFSLSLFCCLGTLLLFEIKRSHIAVDLEEKCLFRKNPEGRNCVVTDTK